jgi:hypothetical protein
MKTYGEVSVQIKVFLTSALVEVNGQLHTPTALSQWKELSVWTTWRKFLTLPELELRLLGHPARSESLYQLHYHGSCAVYFKNFVVLFAVLGLWSIGILHSRLPITGL